MGLKPRYQRARVNRKTPLTTGLTDLYLLNEGAGTVRSLVHPAHTGTMTGHTWGQTEEGVGICSSGATAHYTQLNHDPLSFNKPFTVLIRVRLLDLAVGGGGHSQSFLNFYKSGVGALRFGHDEAVGGRVFASGTFMAGTGRQTPGSTIGTFKAYTLVVTSDATSVKIYRDGAQVDDASNANSNGTTSVLGARDTGAGAMYGNLSLVAFWDGRALTASEIRVLSADPYGLLTTPVRQPRPFWKAAGGGATAFEGTATLGVGASVAANRLGSSLYPTGRTVTADVVRLLTAPVDLWSGNDTPSDGAGGDGDVYFKSGGGLYVKIGGAWVNYATVWKRTGTLIEPLTAGDSLAVPGTLGVTGLGTFATHVLPLSNYVSNLGALAKKYLSLHAAELFVETLVAQSTLATIGGRILVGPTNPLTVDLAAATTTITVKYNNFANGDRVYLEANGNVEWMAITSAAGGSAGAYTYSVTRNLDGSGANDWVAGDAVFSTGTTGAGYIDLYSTRSLRSASHLGPTIVGNVRTGTTYSDLVERWAIGNLDGLYGYSGANYGAAFGTPTGAWIKIDPTNGIRIGHDTTTKITLTAAGVAQLLGIEAMSVVLGSDGYIRQGQTAYDTGTGFWIGDVSNTPKLSIGSSASKLTWDGSVLQVTALSFGGSASVAGAWFGGSDIWLGAPYTGGGDKLFSIGVGSMTNNDSLDIGYVATESANSLAPHSGSTWNLARSDRRFSKAYIQDLYAATGASFRSGSDVAGTANSGTGETTIATVTVAAATLGANGQALRITAFGTFAANGNNKTVKLKIGGTTIVDTTAQAFNGNGYHIELTFIRTGASAEYVSGFYAVPSGGNYNRVGPTSQSLDTTASITILVTGQSGTGSNDIVSRGLLVEAVR